MAGGIGSTKQFNVSNAGRKESHKPQDTKGAVRGLWRYLCHYRTMLFVAVILTITGNLLALVGPKLSGRAIDAIEPGKGSVDFDTVFYYAGLMIIFYIVSSLFSYLLSVVMQNISRKMDIGIVTSITRISFGAIVTIIKKEPTTVIMLAQI